MCMVHRPDVQDAGTCLCGTATVYVCAGGGEGGGARALLFVRKCLYMACTVVCLLC